MNDLVRAVFRGDSPHPHCYGFPCAMRSVAATLLLVALTMGWACAIEFPHEGMASLPAVNSSELKVGEPVPQGALPLGDWRRTTRGWERSDVWPTSSHIPAKPFQMPLNPVIFASWQLLISLAALVFFERSRH